MEVRDEGELLGVEGDSVGAWASRVGGSDETMSQDGFVEKDLKA